MSYEETFWSKVNKNSGIVMPHMETECWIWESYKDKDGYGLHVHPTQNRRKIRAHRMAYLLHYGVDPKEKSVLHHCDNPPCVCPDHLFAGTQKENMQDMIKKGRRTQPDVSGTRNGRAKISEKDVLFIREHYRNGMKGKDLASRFGVSVSTIKRIWKGENWKHIS